MELPHFLPFKDKHKIINYKDEPDTGNETIQDFFLRWTIRCSEEKYININPKICINSKRILFKLLFDDPNLNYKINSVKSWRQLGQIDLLFEIKLNEFDKPFLLNIENKWYTNISDGQLDKYLNFLNVRFDLSQYTLKNYVIYSDSEKINENKNRAESSNYIITSIEDLQDVLLAEKTGNDMFDEFWY